MKLHHTYCFCTLLLICLLQGVGIELYAQKQDVPKARRHRMTDHHRLPADTVSADSLLQIVDSLSQNNSENLLRLEMPADTASLTHQQDSLGKEPVKEKKIFIPNSSRATWLAVVFPGGGQIYNRKYWKLPIIYGGFVGCAYALSWNGQMYKDYSQAYLDIMDNNPNTNSYLDFISPNFDVEGRKDWLKNVLKQRKDRYRRYRDLSVFVFIGVYLISIIDAYVDAELSDFDISKDLGLKIEPAVINDNRGQKLSSVGLQCSITF